MSLKNVEAFYKRLANDEAFRTQIQGAKNKTECTQIVKSAGYDFTQKEFEDYTAKLIELSVVKDDFRDLSGKEMSAVFGGISSIMEVQLPSDLKPYGVPPDLFQV